MSNAADGLGIFSISLKYCLINAIAPAVIGVSVNEGDIEQIAAEIAAHPEVSYLIMVSGEFDLIVEVLCKNREHLASFINYKLRRVDGVERTQTFMTLRTFKMAFGAPPITMEPPKPDNI